MQLDQDIAFGWDPPEWNERELYNELWSLTRIALRNWLKNPERLPDRSESISDCTRFLEI